LRLGAVNIDNGAAAQIAPVYVFLRFGVPLVGYFAFIWEMFALLTASLMIFSGKKIPLYPQSLFSPAPSRVRCLPLSSARISAWGHTFDLSFYLTTIDLVGNWLFMARP
jgi:hypothetical protein